MQAVRDIARPAGLSRSSLPRRTTLFAALAVAGAVGAAQQAPVPDAADGKHGAAATTYRVINLAPGLLSSFPDINGKGQVAFSMQDGSGGSNGYFYNGSALQNIGGLGGSDVRTADLNERGQVTGTADTVLDIDHGFLWSTGGGMLDISLYPNQGAGYSYAQAINNHGVVTGTALPPGAYRWSATSGMESLGTLRPGPPGGLGMALNDAGVIAGRAGTSTNRVHAFAWTRSTGMIDIDTLDSLDSLIVAVGPKGEVAGNRMPSIDNPVYLPFLWTAATGMVDLGTGGGVAANITAMTACLQMSGNVRYADDSSRAFWWTRSTGIRTIGTLGGASSRALDINAAGQIVGWAHNKAGALRAFVWSKKKGMLDLNRHLRHAPPDLVLDDALAISDNGAIVATSNAGLVLLRPDHGHKGSHVLGPLTAPALVKAATPLQAAVSFIDPDRVGVRSVSWSWGEDGSAQVGRVRESAGVKQSSASHSFAAPGIYPVTFTVLEQDGRSIAVSHEVVVTAAGGGALAGAGNVLSPQGALKQQPGYAGKARFGLIAPLNANARAAGIPARLHFDLPGLNLRSQDLRLVGRRGGQHQFEGSATVRGAHGYRFSLSTAATMPGAAQGRFALKVWHTDPSSKAEVVDYDNTAATPGAGLPNVLDGSLTLE